MAETLQTFLIKLAAIVDSQGQREVVSRIDEVTRAVRVLAGEEKKVSQAHRDESERRKDDAEKAAKETADAMLVHFRRFSVGAITLLGTIGSVFAVAAGTVSSVSKTIEKLRDLDRITRRTGASAQNIEILAGTFERIGGKREDAIGAVEGVAEAYRRNRNIIDGLKALGVKDTQDLAKVVAELAPIVKRNVAQFGLDHTIIQMETYGLSAEVIRLLSRGEFSDAYEHERALFAKWNIDYDKTLRDNREMLEQWRVLLLQLENMQLTFLAPFIRGATVFLTEVNRLILLNAGGINDNLAKLGDKLAEFALEYAQKLVDVLNYLAEHPEKIDEAFKSVHQTVLAVFEAVRMIVEAIKYAAEIGRALNKRSETAERAGINFGAAFGGAEPNPIGEPRPEEKRTRSEATEAERKAREATEANTRALEESSREERASRGFFGRLWDRMSGGAGSETAYPGIAPGAAPGIGGGGGGGGATAPPAGSGGSPAGSAPSDGTAGAGGGLSPPAAPSAAPTAPVPSAPPAAPSAAPLSSPSPSPPPAVPAPSRPTSSLSPGSGDAFETARRLGIGVPKPSYSGASEPDLPSFQEGGVVPGPSGKPRLIVAHGGEMVIPAKAKSSPPPLRRTSRKPPDDGFLPTFEDRYLYNLNAARHGARKEDERLRKLELPFGRGYREDETQPSDEDPRGGMRRGINPNIPQGTTDEDYERYRQQRLSREKNASNLLKAPDMFASRGPLTSGSPVAAGRGKIRIENETNTTINATDHRAAADALQTAQQKAFESNLGALKEVA